MIPKATMTLLAEVLDERAKQIADGYTPELDDSHQRGELAQAAAERSLAAVEGLCDELHAQPPKNFPGDERIWPFVDRPAGVPTRGEKTVRQNLISAAALCLAEIERLDRLREAGEIDYCENGHLVWHDEAVVDVEGVVLCPVCADEDGREIAYAHEPDEVARFLRERCDRDPAGHETEADVYMAYLDWLSRQSETHGKHLSQVNFGLRLAGISWITGVTAFGTVHWKGLRLRREG